MACQPPIPVRRSSVPNVWVWLVVSVVTDQSVPLRGAAAIVTRWSKANGSTKPLL
jgi:hypothetical protein